MNGLVFLTDGTGSLPGLDAVAPMSLEDVRNTHYIEGGIAVIDGANETFAHKALMALRQSTCPEVYAVPVVLAARENLEIKRIASAVDRVMAPEDITDYSVQKLRDSFSPMITRLGSVRSVCTLDHESPGPKQDADTNLSVKILRFMYVRQEPVVPVRGTWSRNGYHYPKLAYFLTTDDLSINKVLEYLESQALLEGEFQDKAHFCARCKCAFLNFRETCPHCHSANLVVDDLIHHYRCGHVAPEREFRDGDDFSCPKCGRELKHLGTDYDKPSIVYTCRDCGNVFQEPETSTVCYNCEHTAPPEEQLNQEVKRYALTSVGENAAIYGLDSLFKEVLTGKMQVVPMDTFKVFLEIEINRIRRYKKSDSSLMYFYISHLATMHHGLGDKAQEIFEEISNVVADTLRTSDVITPVNDSTYLALLVETPLEGASIASLRLQENMTSLLEANLGQAAGVKTHVLSIDPEATTDGLVETMLAHLNAQ